MERGRISRRAFAIATALAVPGWSVRPGHAQAKPEKSRLTLAVNGKSGLPFLPLTVAEQLGYFKAEGLDVEIAEITDAAGATGDIICGSYEQTIALQARGQDVQTIVLLGRAPAVALGVSSRTVPHYRELADLRGRRIGVTAAGSLTHLMAHYVLARAGIPAAEVSFVAVGSTAAAPDALRQGLVDALCTDGSVMTMLEHKADVRVISDARTLKGTQGVFGGPMPSACLHAPQEFVQKHPAACQAVVNAVVHALKWLQTAGPRDIIRTMPEPYALGDRALYLASFEKQRESISLDGRITVEGARTALRVLSAVDASVRADRIDLGRTFTNEFAMRAKEKFRI